MLISVHKKHPTSYFSLAKNHQAKPCSPQMANHTSHSQPARVCESIQWGLDAGANFGHVLPLKFLGNLCFDDMCIDIYIYLYIILYHYIYICVTMCVCIFCLYHIILIYIWNKMEAFEDLQNFSKV